MIGQDDELHPPHEDSSTPSDSVEPNPYALVDALLKRIADGGGCGNHSCLITRPHSVGTNGRCVCDHRPMVFQRLAALYREVRDVRARETAL